MNSKEIYEAPQIEIVEFEIEDAITSSGLTGSSFWGTLGGKEIWGK